MYKFVVYNLGEMRVPFFMNIFNGKKIHFHYRSQQTKLEDEHFLHGKKRKLNICERLFWNLGSIYLRLRQILKPESNDIQHSISKDMVFFYRQMLVY